MPAAEKGWIRSEMGKRTILSICVLIVGLLLLGTLSHVLAADQAAGQITGKLTNKTTGGSNVAGVEIDLTTYVNGSVSGSASVKTIDDGSYAFANLGIESLNSYQVTFKYQDVDYDGGTVSFAPGETNKTVNFDVYDSTTNGDVLLASAAHTVIYKGQGNLEVSQYFQITNQSDKAYIGSGEIKSTGTRKTVSFLMAQGGTGLQLGSGLIQTSILPQSGGFIDTMPFFPGVTEISYYYVVPYSTDTFLFSLPVTLPIAQFNLLIPDQSVKVSSSKLVMQTPLSMNGTVYTLLSGANFETGNVITANLSGLSKTGNQWLLIGIILAIAVVGIIFAVIYLKRRNRRQEEPDIDLMPAQDRTLQKHQQLLLELAQLDDDYEEGKIPEGIYKQKRDAKKAQLIELMKDAGEKSKN